MFSLARTVPPLAGMTYPSSFSSYGTLRIVAKALNAIVVRPGARKDRAVSDHGLTLQEIANEVVAVQAQHQRLSYIGILQEGHVAVVQVEHDQLICGT